MIYIHLTVSSFLEVTLLTHPSEGSGHGSPVQAASQSSPIPGTQPRPLTAANLFLNDHNDNNATRDSSANASSSNMAEIITRARPRPVCPPIKAGDSFANENRLELAPSVTIYQLVTPIMTSTTISPPPPSALDLSSPLLSSSTTPLSWSRRTHHS